MRLSKKPIRKVLQTINESLTNARKFLRKQQFHVWLVQYYEQITKLMKASYEEMLSAYKIIHL